MRSWSGRRPKSFRGGPQDRTRNLRDSGFASRPGMTDQLSRHVLIENLHGVVEADGDQLRHAAFGHGDAEQPVHPRHRDRIVRDDDEAGFRRRGHLVQQVAEPLHVVIVERRVDFVQHADRRRVGEEHREDQRQRRQRLLAAGEQRQRLRLLAGRFCNDFEAGFERIVAFDQMQRGFAAAEQLREQPLEVLVDGLERGQQPLAGFLVEALDALAQPLDGFDQVVALGGQRGVLGLDFAQFFLGAQVDGAQPLAVAAQLFEVFLDLGKRRQFGAGLDLGERGDRVRLDFEHVVDLALDVGKAAAGAFHAFLGAGAGFAGAGERFERRLGLAVGFRHHAFGGGERIGGDTAGAFGGFDFVDQRAALLRIQGRRIVEVDALGRHFGDACLDGGDLRGRALLAVLPVGALRGDGLHALVGQLRLARQRLGLGAHLGGEAAVSVDLGADGAEPCFGLVGRREFGQRGFRALMGGFGFAAVGGEAGVGLGQRRLACGVAVDLALGRGVALARGIGLALRGPPGFAAGGFQRRPPPSARSRRLPVPGAWRSHRCGPAPAPVRCRRGGRVRRDAARRRSAHAPPRQSRPSARRRLPARPAAGRSSIGRPVRRRAPSTRRRSGPDGAAVRSAPRHGQRGVQHRRAATDRRSSRRHQSSASARRDRPARRGRRQAQRRSPFRNPWRR